MADPQAVAVVAPGDRAHDRWLQRTVGNAGERLGRLRDRVLDAAGLQRHHVVLDLNAGSGLLTWEILRRAPEGGVWALGEDLRQRLVEAEEAIYADADDPLVNWTAEDLRDALGAADLREIIVQEAAMLVSQATIERWFDIDAQRERPAYAQHLLRRLMTDELAEVQATFRRQLAGQTVVWRTRIAFVVGKRTTG